MLSRRERAVRVPGNMGAYECDACWDSAQHRWQRAANSTTPWFGPWDGMGGKLR